MSDRASAESRAVPVLLDGIVEGQRGGLRLARDVARDHQRDAEVAERPRERQHDRREHAAPSEGELHGDEGANGPGAERARGAHERRVDRLERRRAALHDERQRSDGRGDDRARCA